MIKENTPMVLKMGNVKGTVIIFFISLFLTLSFSVDLGNAAPEKEHDLLIEGWTDISEGLPVEASFSAVDVCDADGDGLDEIYVGGAGRTLPRSAGIRAFEYDTADGEWKKFGIGLPAEGASKYYGALSLDDVDNDGNIDLIAPLLTRWYDGEENGIEVYSSDGEGRFSLAHSIDIDESSNEAVVKDLDNDGYQDIIVSTLSGIRVFFGTGSLDVWTEDSPPSAENEITGIDAGDLNGDGLLDLVGCPYSGSIAVRMYIQSSKRGWEEVAFKEVKREGFGIRISDIDGDGNSDVIYGTRNEGIKAWLGNGGGSPGSTELEWKEGGMGLHDSGGNWDQLELQDMTGDGKPELIAANNGGDEVFLYINDLPEGWTWIFRGDPDSDDPLLNKGPMTIGGHPYGANFGDWNGDGITDCAACSWGAGVKAWLIQGKATNGSGPISYPEGGEDPPDIWGADDYRYMNILLTAAVILLILVMGSAQVANLSWMGYSRIQKTRNRKRNEKGPIWYFDAANISIIVGGGILLLFQITAIVYSISFDNDVRRLPFWDPPEFIGVFFLGLFGSFSFLTMFEIARITYSRGISRLKEVSEEGKMHGILGRMRRLNLLSSLLVYSSVILIILISFDFIRTEKVAIVAIFFQILVLTAAMLSFEIAHNLIPIMEGNMKKLPIASIISGSIMIPVLLFQMLFIPEGRSDLQSLMLIYPIVFGILIMTMAVLNLFTMRRSLRSFKGS